MKKIKALLIILTVFFIGNITTKADSLECKYTNGELISKKRITLNTKNGIISVDPFKSESGKGIIVNSSDTLRQQLTVGCPEKIVGFTYEDFIALNYYLFVQGEDELQNRQKQAILKEEPASMKGKSDKFTVLLFDLEKEKIKESTVLDNPDNEDPTTINFEVDPEQYEEIKEEIREDLNKEYSLDNGLSGTYTSCGNGTIKKMPTRLVKIINTIVRIIQIGVPIVIIILGMIDFAKGALAQKEDEMKKSQKVFFKRLITGILVFLVILIVKMAVRFVNESSESSKIISCVDCFINGRCQN